MTDFKTISLSEIHPDKNQPRKFFNDAALAELTESVRSKGVLQPIMVRLNGKGYSLVCGERRYKASLAAGLKDIPAVVRILSDEEALEIQFIENIQRDDVHPMDEATTFKAMLENKVHPYTLADIAAKINKPEKYVSHRLSLNNLIPQLQEEFWKGKFLIGHAVLFSKLSPEDQKEAAKECKSFDGKNYEPIAEVKDFIERNILRILTKAPFSKEDPTLNPKMGACVSCPFRSGNNPTLFDEVKETDRCYKPSCFTIKLENYTIKKVESIILEDPEILLLASGNSNNKILTAIFNKAKEFDVKINKEYTDFNTYGSGPSAKGIWVNGSDIGKIEKVYLTESKVTSKGADNKSASAASVDDEIAGIKQRTIRAAQLDDEKVWSNVRSLVTEKELVSDGPLSPEELTAATVAMYEKIGYTSRGKVEKFLSKSSANTIAKTAIDQKTFNKFCRFFLLDVLNIAYGSHTGNNGPQVALYNVLKNYFPEKITTFELEQQEKREKREARAAQRIKALQEQKKEAIAEKKISTNSVKDKSNKK